MAYNILTQDLREYAKILADAGKKIHAIKLVRSVLGYDLIMAKNWVEQLYRPIEAGDTVMISIASRQYRVIAVDGDHAWLRSPDEDRDYGGELVKTSVLTRA